MQPTTHQLRLISFALPQEVHRLPHWISYYFAVVLPLLRSKRAREPSGAQIKRFEASEQLSAHELL